MNEWKKNKSASEVCDSINKDVDINLNPMIIQQLSKKQNLHLWLLNWNII